MIVASEAWTSGGGSLEQESALEGGEILGRCALLREPVGDQEGRELVRAATGLLVRLQNGRTVGVWWRGPHPGVFVWVIRE